MTKRIAILVSIIGLVATPAAASPRKLTRSTAHASPAELIKKATGPTSTVWDCHAHGHGTICRWRMPLPGMVEVENETTGESTVGVWESYAVVERGRVRFS